jgi:SAM-dependent methyltransferase
VTLEPPRRHVYDVVAPQEQFIVPLLREEIRETIHRYALPGTDALDVGCGLQPFRSLIEEHGVRYFGFDRPQSGAKDLAFTGSIDEPLPAPLRGRRFALVLCTEVLEHVFGWTAAFANLASLLEPGGHVIITAPHVYPLHEEPWDFWRPTTFALERQAADAELEVVSLKRLGDAWDVIGTVLATTAPRSRGGLVHRPALLVARAIRVAGLRMARSTWARGHLDLNSPLYLSNVAVLRHPSA